MPTTATRKSPTLVPRQEPVNVEQQIRDRAYELYEARGREDGHDLEDWHQAEKEINWVTRLQPKA